MQQIESDSSAFGGGDVRRGGQAILVAVCLAMAGCNLFGKKKPDAQQPPPNFPAQTAANTTPTSNPRGVGGPFSTTSNPKAPLPNASGMLAGRVICSYDRLPPPTLIQVSMTGEKTGDNKPQEIATDTEGYFTIQGLVPGQGYQLSAKTRDGDVKMGGITFAIAPNPRVLIRISEEFAPQAPPSKKSDKSTTSNDTSNVDAPARTLGAPTSIGSTADINQPPPEVNRDPSAEQIAARDRSERERINLSINSGGRGPPPSQGEAGNGSNPTVSARVPSCVMSIPGVQLDNFALYDLTGTPWEYRNHTGKLVLLDFWGTWCPPCLKSLPHLKLLSEKYGKNGLEVIGIACELQAPAVEQVKRIEAVRIREKLPYRILFGGSREEYCPVRAQFKVKAFPSLFLLDEKGTVIWKCDHYPSTVELRDLDHLILARLQRK